jgi:hypothetical protein
VCWWWNSLRWFHVPEFLSFAVTIAPDKYLVNGRLTMIQGASVGVEQSAGQKAAFLNVSQGRDKIKYGRVCFYICF